MPQRFRATLCVLVLFASEGVLASEALYHWFDREGRPHFSDQPPPDGVNVTERFPVPSFAAPEQPADEAPYSILNQLKRLEESRERLTQQRREQQEREQERWLRQRELEARSQVEPPAVSPPVYVVPRRPYLPPPRPTWHAPPTRPPSLWEPDHPAFRPYPRPRHPGPVYGREGFEPAH